MASELLEMLDLGLMGVIPCCSVCSGYVAPAFCLEGADVALQQRVSLAAKHSLQLCAFQPVIQGKSVCLDQVMGVQQQASKLRTLAQPVQASLASIHPQGPQELCQGRKS